jgi:hypothetical protein
VLRGPRRQIWLWGAALVGLATAARVVWALSIPTVPVSDFAMYRESANYLSEFGRLDHGFIYMPGFVALLAAIKNLGGDLLAQKMAGVFFGGLGAAGLFVLTWRVLDADPAGDPQAASAGWRRLCPCPHAAVATAIYALWPAGVAMSSVVGTDVPAAALIVTALALLAALGARRPFTAAVAFGVAMGLAAWVRAVALPLSALSLGYWLGRRERPLRALALAGAGLGAALVVLSPWALRHLSQSGTLYFTDDHGGITALIGANPNSEGTYTRALNQMFKDVTGRSVLDEPHHTTDQAAYAIVREWTRFEPRYTLGLVTLKAERLFDPEIRLLYWPIFRPGVLTGQRAAWFAAHHAGIESLADGFGLVVLGLAAGGIVVAFARRRWTAVSLVPYQLALVATYTIFFAEPRYRLPIELLAFPFVACALGEVARLAAALRRRSRAEGVVAVRNLGVALAVVVAGRLVWPAIVDGGRALRAAHRWAATEATVQCGAGPRTQMLLWRPSPPLDATSPVEGAPNGVHLRVGPQGLGRVRVRLSGALSPGSYDIGLRVASESDASVQIVLADRGAVVAPRQAVDLSARLPSSGTVELDASVQGPPGASIWVTDIRILASGFDDAVK